MEDKRSLILADSMEEERVCRDVLRGAEGVHRGELRVQAEISSSSSAFGSVSGRES